MYFLISKAVENDVSSCALGDNVEEFFCLCLREVLKNRFATSVLSPVLAMSTSLFCLDLLALLMARYLHTSMLAALETGNPTSEAQGYASQCCILVTEGMLNHVLKAESQTSSDENIRPSVPAMCGRPPQPYISSSTTKS